MMCRHQPSLLHLPFRHHHLLPLHPPLSQLPLLHRYPQTFKTGLAPTGCQQRLVRMQMHSCSRSSSELSAHNPFMNHKSVPNACGSLPMASSIAGCARSLSHLQDHAVLWAGFKCQQVVLYRQSTACMLLPFIRSHARDNTTTAYAQTRGRHCISAGPAPIIQHYSLLLPDAPVEESCLGMCCCTMSPWKRCYFH